MSSSSNSSINSDNCSKNQKQNKTLNEMIASKSFCDFDANDADDDDDENKILNESIKMKNSNRSILSSKRYSSSCNQILKSLSVKHDEVFESNEPNLVSCNNLFLFK